MRYRGKSAQYVISLAIVYAGIKYLMPHHADAAAVVFLAFFIPFVILRRLIINYYYKCSSNIVPKPYKVNFNTIQNDNVTVTFTPSKKIVVMDTMT